MTETPDTAEKNAGSTTAAPASGGGLRGALATAGWFVLGFLLLAAASALVELTLAAMARAAVTTRSSIWSTMPAVALGAFLAAMTAITIGRRHPRLGRETLRATWAVALIDLVMAAAGVLRGVPGLDSVATYEGIGFVAAAIVMTPWSRLAVGLRRARE